MNRGLAILFVLVSMGTVCGEHEALPPCEQVDSYDECARLAHCSAMSLMVDEGHTGPIWRCEPKHRR